MGLGHIFLLFDIFLLVVYILILLLFISLLVVTQLIMLILFSLEKNPKKLEKSKIEKEI